MKLTETKLEGVFHIRAEPNQDDRGSFARLYCADEFAEAGIDFAPVQVNLSSNLKARTLRGMHYQKPPHGEAKLVQVTAGAIFDVAVDLRPGPGFGKWVGYELSRENGEALYLPHGIAHGFLTLTDHADVLYHMGNRFVPGQAAGVRWNDPDIAIAWPHDPLAISDRDQTLPDLASLLDT